jgi:hypothetical protein
MIEWNPIPGRPGFEMNGAGRVRRVTAVRDLPDMETKGYAVMRAHQGAPLIAIDLEHKVRIVEQYKLSDVEIPLRTHEVVQSAEEAGFDIELRAPSSWTKGQLLNIRNRGEFYVVTLLGEEDEPPLRPAPSGALKFTNPALCQDFISRWYMREHYDARAF